MSAKPHLWSGEWIDDRELDRRLSRISEWALEAVGRPFDVQVVLAAADAYSSQLSSKTGNYPSLIRALRSGSHLSVKESEAALGEMAAFLERGSLTAKLKAELGSLDPYSPWRTSFKDSIFEAWAPLGVLVHVAPSNSPTVAPLSAIEGLLAGNANVLKISSADGPFGAMFLEGLLKQDKTRTLRQLLVAARISSSRTSWMKSILSCADGVAIWGGEEAVESVKTLAPSSARLIEWGHKISIAYLASEFLDDSPTLEKAAAECCVFEQQSCSSPQCIYLDTDDWNVVEAFAVRFSKVLDKVSRKTRRTEPAPSERAEISLVTELARQEACLDKGRVIEAGDRSWRVLADPRPSLAASPLFRTIWIKPLPRRRIVEVLRPMNHYLQTAGIACGLKDLADLSERFVRAGAIRVRRIGDMTGSYAGEPHDGVYALQRYSRRISIQAGEQARGILGFADLKRDAPPAGADDAKIMTKSDFQEISVDPRHAHLYFKSGGSSGRPKTSVFSYDDYREQMRIGAEGLYAAGLDPLTDRCMNLFYSGSLYGSFLSMFSVLEELGAVQFPMTAVSDFAMAAEAIVKHDVNLLLGMPSYLIQLFESQATQLKRYGGVKKIYFGGEHFSDAQRRYLESFGVQLIRSLGYGSVDTGPLGYQCIHCEPGVHHVFQRLQYLEIVELDADKPVKDGKVGRLVFSSRVRHGQNLRRYEIGDIGQWISGDCPCGRASPRFKLLGRTGDVFRTGSMFLNFQKFADILSMKLSYVGPVQLMLSHDGLKEKVTVRLLSEGGENGRRAIEALLAGYRDLQEAVVGDKTLALDVARLPNDEFIRAKGSGKIIRIVDRRKR